MKIEIEIKAMADMRYPTVGDYYTKDDGTVKFEIAETGKPIYNFMVLIHELVEYALIAERKLPIAVVDEFDFLFEKEREDNYHDLDEEPGFDNRSPYRQEHTLATAVEMMMCAQAGLSWKDYNEAIITL